VTANEEVEMASREYPPCTKAVKIAIAREAGVGNLKCNNKLPVREGSKHVRHVCVPFWSDVATTELIATSCIKASRDCVGLLS
jgi:hypothetical protein